MNKETLEKSLEKEGKMKVISILKPKKKSVRLVENKRHIL